MPTYPSTENRKTLSTTNAKKALMCLNLNLSKEQEEKIINYMKDRFHHCSCVVLCKKLPSGKFLEKLGVDIGTQEIVIKENGGIFYSHSYLVPVHEVA